MSTVAPEGSPRPPGERGAALRRILAAVIRPPAGPGGWLLRAALLALLYCLSGWAGLQLARPPGYATPIWPPSGIMLAMLLLWGRGLWPGVWLGAFAVNVWAGCAQAAGPLLNVALVAASIATGSTAAGIIGARLVRRHVSAPTVLDSGRDIGLFFALGGLVATAIAASIGTLTLFLAGALAPRELPAHWLTWWIGDCLGVILIAPLLLLVAAEQRRIWRDRLRPVAFTVAIVLGLGAIVIQETNDAESARIAARFNESALTLDRRLIETVNGALGAVGTTVDFFDASTLVEPVQFERFADGQLQRAPGLTALLWVPRVAAADLVAHERDAAADGAPGYRVREIGARGELLPARRRDEYFPLRYIWPPAGRHMLGFDLGSEAQRRATLQAAEAQQALRVSGPVAVPTAPAHTVLAVMPVDAVQGRGFIVGAVVLERLMQHILADGAAGQFSVVLEDVDAAGPAQRLAAAGAAADGADLAWTDTHSVGGRTWRMTVTATDAYLRANRSTQAWLTEVGVLLFAALFGGFLLVLTGRSARVQELVAARTAELEEKNRALSREVLERQASERRLSLSAKVFEHIGEAIMITDADNRIISVNRAFTEITGYTEDEVRDSNPRVLASGRHDDAFYAEMWQRLNDTGVWRGEVWDRRKNGECYPEWLNIALVRDASGRVTHHVAVFSDISERKAVEERITFLAQVDALTHLPNRYLLGDRLQQTLEVAQRNDERFAVVFIDLDRFKNINDSLGHGVGDALLRETAARLHASVRSTDTVARHGGDEFVIIMPGIADAEQVAHVATKILEQLARPFGIEHHRLTTTASLGIALYPADGTDAETLMKHADAAMYAAKNAGRNAFRFFTPDMNARVREFLKIENDLRLALQRGELRLHYQPQIEMRSGEVVGAEALLRWQHPERGLILPGEFMHVAEESGLIEPIGDWVLVEACRQNRDWQDRGLRRIPISVNLSAVQLRRRAIVHRVEAALHQGRLDAGWLELEVTESMLMRDVERIGEILEELCAMGVRIALDDFGTGYSSLAHLRRFPLSTLKLDGSFVRDLETDSNDAAICRAVIALGHTLGLRVVAEGVENDRQLAFLRRERCDAVQGALFSWGVPPETMAAFLDPSLVLEPTAVGPVYG
ncbi:MAG: EAL domain-containing protein [Pseudomonadota bacterium]